MIIMKRFIYLFTYLFIYLFIVYLFIIYLFLFSIFPNFPRIKQLEVLTFKFIFTAKHMKKSWRKKKQNKTKQTNKQTNKQTIKQKQLRTFFFQGIIQLYSTSKMYYNFTQIYYFEYMS